MTTPSLPERMRQAGLDAFRLWGTAKQLAMVKEELAELIVAVSHLERYRNDADAVVEEIADVYIVLRELRAHLEVRGVTDAIVDAAILRKLERLEQRIRDDGAGHCGIANVPGRPTP